MIYDPKQAEFEQEDEIEVDKAEGQRDQNTVETKVGRNPDQAEGDRDSAEDDDLPDVGGTD
ncbi:MAG: hypothetical protein SGJ24_06060 [Chloroflexota bacterium]|nr:hypothetical protein [Chloroflexota bacterium]